MEHVFGNTWVYVGHESEIPSPGDFVLRWIGRQSAVSMLAGREAVQRRFITTMSAKVKPDTSPQPSPCTIGFERESSGTSRTSCRC